MMVIALITMPALPRARRPNAAMVINAAIIRAPQVLAGLALNNAMMAILMMAMAVTQTAHRPVVVMPSSPEMRNVSPVQAATLPASNVKLFAHKKVHATMAYKAPAFFLQAVTKHVVQL